MTSKQLQPLTAFVVAEPSLLFTRTVESWLACGHQISVLWTRSRSLVQPKRKWRPVRKLLGHRSIESICRRDKLLVHQYDDNAAMLEAITKAQEDLRPDVLLTVGTGLIIPPSVLGHFGRRAINCHPSYLPHYKGPDPVAGMLVDGQADTCGGVTFHVIEEGIDAGPIIGQRRLPRCAYPNNLAWSGAMARAASDIVQDEINRYLAGSLEAQPQAPASGSYRKTVANEFVVTDDKSLEETVHILNALKGLGPTCVPSGTKPGRSRFRVKDIRHCHGAATGEDPEIRENSITMDLSDSRVTLARLNQMDKWNEVRQLSRGGRVDPNRSTIRRNPKAKLPLAHMIFGDILKTRT